MANYEPVIGLEVHVQMNTNTKLFCNCSNDSFNAQANTNVCPVCMGFPGQLPVTNMQAIEKAVKTGLALNCEIALKSKFDRKQYFYPDLPSGFQISQYDEPLCQNGFIEITKSDGTKKKIRINRIHVENDAGKLTHTSHGTLCDYNRAGTPLMEIVSEADIRSIEEASLYAQEIQKIVRYIGTSDADMEKGHLRFDLNLSLRPVGEEKFGTRTETKNLNSFTTLEKAAEFEMKRQTKELDAGNSITQETRGWDDQKLQSFSQRSKEEAHDYRYFPEPDLPPILVKESKINELQETLPELPRAKFERYLSEYNLSEEDARILTDEPARANFFEVVMSVQEDPKLAVSFINTILAKKLSDDYIGFEKSPVSAENLGELLKLIQEGTISNNQAKTIVLDTMYETGKDAQTVIEEKGLKQVSDTGALTEMVKEAIAMCPQAIEDYNNGKEKALGAIVGKVMQLSKGQANPGVVNQILRKELKS